MKIETGLQVKKKFIEATAPLPPKIHGPLGLWASGPPLPVISNPFCGGIMDIFWNSTFQQIRGKLSLSHIILVCVLLAAVWLELIIKQNAIGGNDKLEQCQG